MIAKSLAAAGVTTCALLTMGVPQLVHRQVKTSHRQEVRELQSAANQAHTEALAQATRAQEEDVRRAEGERAEANERRASAKRQLKNAKLRYGPAMKAYRAATQAMTPNGPKLLLSKPPARDLIQQVTDDGLRGKAGYQGASVSQASAGFRLTITCQARMTWGQKMTLVKGIEQVRSTLPGHLVSEVVFARPGSEKTLNAGSLANLDRRRAASSLAAFYLDQTSSLPQANLVGRHMDPDVIWMVENGTDRTITVDHFGPTHGSVKIAPGRTQKIRLEPGHYRLTVSAGGSWNVQPYSGSADYEGGSAYGSRFYIQTVPTYGRNPSVYGNYRRWASRR